MDYLICKERSFKFALTAFPIFFLSHLSVLEIEGHKLQVFHSKQEKTLG